MVVRLVKKSSSWVTKSSLLVIDMRLLERWGITNKKYSQNNIHILLDEIRMLSLHRAPGSTTGQGPDNVPNKSKHRCRGNSFLFSLSWLPTKTIWELLNFGLCSIKSPVSRNLASVDRNDRDLWYREGTWGPFVSKRHITPTAALTPGTESRPLPGGWASGAPWLCTL